MKLLAAEGALATLSGHWRQQVWNAAALHAPPELLQEAPVDEDFLELPEAPEEEDVRWDYASVGLTLRSHPMALLRKKLDKYKLKTSEEASGDRNAESDASDEKVVMTTPGERRGTARVIRLSHRRSFSREGESISLWLYRAGKSPVRALMGANLPATRLEPRENGKQ